MAKSPASKEVFAVQPIESVHDETVKVPKVKSTDPFDSCINCGGDLNDEFICENCGYNRNIVYNLNLENKKEREQKQ